VSEVSVAFCHSQLLHLVHLGVAVVYLDPALDGSTSLSNVHFATLTGDAIYAWQIKAQVMFDMTEQPVDFPVWQANHLEIMS
jgi:hypothetical protein